jgi:outer membrane receptor for ferrienterochelin and colicins
MRLRFLPLLLMVLCTEYVFAQSKIQVSVTGKDNEGVAFAYVNLYTGNNSKTPVLTEQTDENGMAVLNVQNDVFPATIEVFAMGYSKIKETITSPLPILNYKLIPTLSTLNEVVVTGTAAPVRMKDALSTYQVISREQIKNSGSVTLDDALKYQLNMNIGSDPVLGSNLRMQGMNGDKVKILIDGMPVNGRENGNINLAQLNLNNAERIEIIQGPMSTIYGSDALGGVINIITAERKKRKALYVNGYYESIGKYNGDISGTFQVKSKHQVTLGGGRNFFGGYRNIDKPISYGGVSTVTERDLFFMPTEQYIANAAYSYTATSGFKLRLMSDVLQEKITDKGSLNTWNPFGATAIDQYFRTSRYQNRLLLSGKLGKSGAWTSQNSYNVYYRTRNRYTKDLVTLNETLITKPGESDTSKYENITLRGTYSNAYKAFSYSAGYDVNMEFANSLKISGNRREIHDYAVFTNLAYELLKDKLTAQVGLRGAHNTLYSAPVVPSFNLLYKPIEKVQIRGSYAYGFRAPSVKEMYLSFIDNNHYLIGNPNLVAEKSKHTQVSASYQIIENNTGYMQLMVTGFYNDVYNGIILVPIRPEDPNSIEYTYANLDHQKNVIGNAQVDGQWNNLHYTLGYARNHNIAIKGISNAFHASEASATLGYFWKAAKLNLNAFYKYTGKQPFAQFDITGTVGYNGRQEPYHYGNVSLQRKFFDNKLELIAGVKNVLNTQIRITGGNFGGGGHAGSNGVSTLPRSLYTSVRITLD